VLPVDDTITGSDLVEEYHRLLTAGDGPGMAALFAEDSYVREPLGTIARGLAEVQRWHDQFAEGSGAGMPLNWCSIIEQGRVSAFEYMAESWGDSVFAPIGGIVVFDRSEDNRLVATRVYEEASPED
jgi:SnoaL-like domain